MRTRFCKIDDTQYSATLQGSTYLGRMFGTFYYDATVTGNTFQASYSSKKDYGTWVMSR
ncbi:MAG: hypothetical protein WBF93_04810 [Pirellulales bacterium]